jgi:2-phospho-L-lactate/phosphoenolpyruvate guanylyltransferase
VARDAVQVLEPPSEPDLDRRQRDRLADMEPGLGQRSASPSTVSGRERTAQRRLPLAPVRAIALPVKSLDDAKSRLGPVLSPLERAALTLAMLEDVMDATLAMPGWESWVVSPDESALEVAARRGAEAIHEAEPPLSRAIHQVEEEALGRGLDALAVLLPDTPLVTTPVLVRALHTLGPVVIAPSLDETGTNLLVRRPPLSIPARFGVDSYRKHLQAAAEADVPTAVVEAPELAFDLDVADDILTVLEAARPCRTREVLIELDAPGRLAADATGT